VTYPTVPSPTLYGHLFSRNRGPTPKICSVAGSLRHNIATKKLRSRLQAFGRRQLRSALPSDSWALVGNLAHK